MNIAFEDVSVEYAHGAETLHALSHLNLAVEAGEALAIIGPSGCGKSTMLRLAAGLMQPASGCVLAGGELVERPRNDTALILQDFGLLPWKTVLGNTELGLRVHKVSRDEARSRALAALERVGLKGFERNYAGELSGGMQQRLALARALAMDVRCLLMDEPLSALDALLREELQEALLAQWLESGYTQILVTHSIEEAVFLGRRIVVMAPRPGRVVAEVANPQAGTPGWREQELFFERCRRVREELVTGGAR